MNCRIEQEIFGMEEEEQEAKLELDALINYIRKASQTSQVASQTSQVASQTSQVNPVSTKNFKRVLPSTIKPTLTMDMVRKAMITNKNNVSLASKDLGISSKALRDFVLKNIK